MGILGTDLHIKGSVVSGAAGNTVANGGAGTNLGKYCSTGDETDNVANNLFPDATGDENAANNVDYQLVFIHNAHATLTYQNVVAWINTEVSGGATIAIAADSVAASAVGGAGAQGLLIASKNTAPAGPLTFTSPTSKATGISLGNIGPGQVKGVWYQRTCTNSAALNADGGQLRFEGDTVA